MHSGMTRREKFKFQTIFGISTVKQVSSDVILSEERAKNPLSVDFATDIEWDPSLRSG